MFTVSLNLLFISLFQVRYIKGNKFMIAIIIGLANSSGNLLSGLIIRYYTDFKVYVTSLFIVIISVNLRTSTTLYELVDPKNQQIIEIGLFFVQIFCIGACVNLQYVIFGTRMKPSLIFASSELCFCTANLIASTAPIVATCSEQMQTLFITSFCIVGMNTVYCFSRDSTKKIDVEKSII